MIKQKDIDLLYDLVKLLKKYGPEAFESLQNLMASGELSGKIASLLTSLKVLEVKKPLISETTRSKRIEKLETSMEKQLSALKDSQPKKYSILEQFYRQAQARQILAARKDAENLALGLGLNVPKKASRESIIIRIVQQFSDLPQEQLESWIKKIVERSKSVQTLEEWAEVILKKRNDF